MPSKEKGSLSAICLRVSGYICFRSCVFVSVFVARQVVFFYDSLRKMKIYLAWEDEKNNLANLGNFTKLSDKIN